MKNSTPHLSMVTKFPQCNLHFKKGIIEITLPIFNLLAAGNSGGFKKEKKSKHVQAWLQIKMSSCLLILKKSKLLLG